MQPNLRRGASETGTVPTARVHHKEQNQQMVVKNSGPGVCATVAVSLAGDVRRDGAHRSGPGSVASEGAGRICRGRDGSNRGRARGQSGPRREPPI